MPIAAKTYYSLDSKRKVPAFIHVEKCWPAVDKYSPCEVNCPLHMDVPNYIIAVAEGNANKALAIIRESNPLPSICGRVCHHPCETECNRKVVDSPIAIQWLKQFAADWGQEEKPTPVKKTKKSKVAIVGSGPAGLTAAYDLAKKGYGVAIFEADSVPGGILASAIPDFILSKEAVQKDVDYIKALGVQIHTNIKIGKDVTLDALKEQGFKAILIATGAQNSIMLKIPGADLKGVTPALSYLKEAKRGQLKSFNGRVWVIGGGAVAMDVARTAVRNGAKEVHVACLESRETMPAFGWEIEAAEKENVHIHPSLAPQEFTGKNSAKVSGIKFKRVSSTSLDSDGRIHWTLAEGTGSDYEVEADAVIIAIGQTIDKDSLPSKSADLSRKGILVINEATGETNVAGVFAAGDVSGTGRTVSDSMAAGRTAAISIDQYLSGEPISQKKSAMAVITIKPEQVPGYFVKRERWEMPQLQSRQAVKTNKEVHLGYAYWQAVEEANRCLNCRMCANCVFERGQLCFETAARLL